MGKQVELFDDSTIKRLRTRAIDALAFTLLTHIEALQEEIARLRNKNSIQSIRMSMLAGDSSLPADRLPAFAELARLQIVNVNLLKEMNGLREEIRSGEVVCDMLADLLRDIAVALKGLEEPGVGHDWNDLPKVAEKLRVSLDTAYSSAMVAEAQVRDLLSSDVAHLRYRLKKPAVDFVD